MIKTQSFQSSINASSYFKQNAQQPYSVQDKIYGTYQQKPQSQTFQSNSGKEVILNQNQNTEEDEDIAMMDLPDEMEYSLDDNKPTFKSNQNSNELNQNENFQFQQNPNMQNQLIFLRNNQNDLKKQSLYPSVHNVQDESQNFNKINLQHPIIQEKNFKNNLFDVNSSAIIVENSLEQTPKTFQKKDDYNSQYSTSLKQKKPVFGNLESKSNGNLLAKINQKIGPTKIAGNTQELIAYDKLNEKDKILIEKCQLILSQSKLYEMEIEESKQSRAKSQDNKVKVYHETHNLIKFNASNYFFKQNQNLNNQQFNDNKEMDKIRRQIQEIDDLKQARNLKNLEQSRISKERKNLMESKLQEVSKKKFEDDNEWRKQILKSKSPENNINLAQSIRDQLSYSESKNYKTAKKIDSPKKIINQNLQNQPIFQIQDQSIQKNQDIINNLAYNQSIKSPQNNDLKYFDKNIFNQTIQGKSNKKQKFQVSQNLLKSTISQVNKITSPIYQRNKIKFNQQKNEKQTNNNEIKRKSSEAYDTSRFAGQENQYLLNSGERSSGTTNRQLKILQINDQLVENKKQKQPIETFRNQNNTHFQTAQLQDIKNKSLTIRTSNTNFNTSKKDKLNYGNKIITVNQPDKFGKNKTETVKIKSQELQDFPDENNLNIQIDLDQQQLQNEIDYQQKLHNDRVLQYLSDNLHQFL